jgi:predicted HTH domain antitoxin
MTLIIHLPAELEQRLRTQSPQLEAEAKEALLIELYRQDKISHHELGQALGLHRFETDALLKKHNVTEDLPSAEEYNAALKHLTEMTNK